MESEEGTVFLGCGVAENCEEKVWEPVRGDKSTHLIRKYKINFPEFTLLLSLEFLRKDQLVLLHLLGTGP